MKKIYSILAVMTLAATSCSWLDITPADTVVEEELFGEAEGFHNAINGLYNSMSDSELYGRELSYGFVEVLSQNYVDGGKSYIKGLSTYSSYYPLFKFDYTKEGVQNIIEGIWKKAYFTIANANNIIVNIESLTPDKFRDGQEEKNLIKGEALAVRAMMHFDMLRLFAPAPIVDDKKPHIPYLEDFPYYGGQPNETVDGVLQKTVRDLIEAKKLIASYDTLDVDHRSNLSSYRRFQLSTGGSNAVAFYEYRGYRMNYMAVTGMLARVYNYWGKHAEAFAQAKEASEFVSEKKNELAALSYSSGTQMQHDRKFSSDLMFCLSDINMTENYQTYSTPTSNDYFNMNAKVIQFEGVPEADAGDNRLIYLVEKNEKFGQVGFRPLKYLKLDNGNETANKVADMLPVMRLSEMHLIMAEAKASEGNFSMEDGANYYLNLIREGRNCKKMDLGITNMDEFKKQLFMEVRKEYFNEGHTFYYFKKYNELLTAKMHPEAFVIPTPQSENVN